MEGFEGDDEDFELNALRDGETGEQGLCGHRNRCE